MEELLRQILKEIQELKEDVQGLKSDVRRLEAGQEQLNQRVTNIEGQLSENTEYIKALLHRTEELDAKFDGLLHTTATKESLASLATKEDIANLDAKFEVLNSRLFQNEAEVQRLKAIK